MKENLEESAIPYFEKLSYGTMRRYQSFFNLKATVKDKPELVDLIKDHFDSFDIENEKVIENFIRIEKDQNNEKNTSLRKSIRFQEKNMAKFLDNFNTYK